MLKSVNYLRLAHFPSIDHVQTRWQALPVGVETAAVEGVDGVDASAGLQVADGRCRIFDNHENAFSQTAVVPFEALGRYGGNEGGRAAEGDGAVVCCLKGLEIAEGDRELLVLNRRNGVAVCVDDDVNIPFEILTVPEFSRSVPVVILIVKF